MKITAMLAVLLLAAVAPPAGHGAHRRKCLCAREVPHQHLRPLRIVRSPQAPKQVRVVRTPRPQPKPAK